MYCDIFAVSVAKSFLGRLEVVKKLVVAAAFMRGAGAEAQVFAAARAYPPELRGLFELPGGKVEPGERPSDALVREIREELGCDIELRQPVLSADEDGAWPVLGGRRMLVWLARPIGALQVGDGHLEARWVTASDLHDIAWIEPDVPIVEATFKLYARGLDSFGTGAGPAIY